MMSLASTLLQDVLHCAAHSTSTFAVTICVLTCGFDTCVGFSCQTFFGLVKLQLTIRSWQFNFQCCACLIHWSFVCWMIRSMSFINEALA